MISWNFFLLTGTVVNSLDKWILVKFILNQLDFHVMCIYAPTNYQDRCALWVYILPVILDLQNILVCGDFNEVLHASECVGARLPSSLLAFHDFVWDNELHDLLL